MKRHWKLTVAVACVLILAGIGIGLAVGLSGPSPSHSTAAAAATQFTQPQQTRLEDGLTAQTLTAEARVVAIEVRSEFEQRGRLLLPAGSHLSISDTTFHALSAQLATVNATVTGSSPRRWKLVIVRERGQWLLLGTKRLS